MVAALAAGGSLAAQNGPGWRYFGAADGLPESFVNSLVADPSGAVWSAHGTSGMSRMDGYMVETRFPVLRSMKTLFWLQDGIWTLDISGLQHLRGNGWESHLPEEIKGAAALATSGPKLRALGGGRFTIILPSFLAVYDPSTRQAGRVLEAAETSLQSFNDAVQAPDGRILVTGTGGVALCTVEGNPVAFHCRNLPLPDPSLKLFHDAQPDFAGGFVIGSVSALTGEERLLGFDGKGWRTLVQGDRARLRGWPAGGGSFWVQKYNNLFLLRQGRLEPVPQHGALLGTVSAVVPQPGGILLVGTSQGLARYSPPLWRTPEALSGLEMIATGAIEDRKGRLWLCYTDRLVNLDNGQTREIPIPKEAMLNDTSRPILLGDGSLAFLPYDRQRLLVFNPDTGAFRQVVHPSGEGFGALAARPDGSAWVRVGLSDLDRFRLDVFDGRSFRPGIDLHPGFHVDYLKFIFEDRDGTVWSGGPAWLGRVRNGVLSLVDARGRIHRRRGLCVLPAAGRTADRRGKEPAAGVRRPHMESADRQAGPGTRHPPGP